MPRRIQRLEIIEQIRPRASRVQHAVGALAALSACYAPTISAGAPCALDDTDCPLGQRCIATAGGAFCLTSEPIADAAARPTDAELSSTDAADSLTDAAVNLGYRASVLADHPIGYWRLGDTSATAADASGNGTAGSYRGGITQGVSGAIVNDADTAARFDGQTAAITIASGLDFIDRTAFSIEAWIRPSAFDDVFRHVFTKQRRTTPRQGYALLLQRDEGIKFERFVDDTGIATSVVITPPTTAFTHIVASYDGAVMRLYVNGQQVNHIGDDRAQLPVTEPAVIGAANPTDALFAGSIDEVAIYAAALPAARVEAHYLAATMPR